MNKKVLIITYYWPPSGGPGVQRVLKFAKYLPELGWDPIILTVKDGEYPAYDESLLDDIPTQCKIYKTKAIEPNLFYRKFMGMKADEKIPVATLAREKKGWKNKLSNWVRLNLFIPDAKIGWKYFAVKQGKKIIQAEKPDLILSSSPPPTVHLIAKKLAAWSGLKWVADFRDPWTKIHYLQGQNINPLSGSVNKKLETGVIKSCDKAICVSQNFVGLLSQEHAHKFEVITNGYDEEPGIAPKEDDGKFTLVYIGGLTWNRYYDSFFSTLVALINEGALDRHNVKLQVAGSISPDIKQLLMGQLDGLKHVEFLGYLPHAKAVELMYHANLLLLFLEKVEGYEGHIPGKLFEYISTHNPVLGIGSTQGESAQILKKTKIGNMLDPEDKRGMRENILMAYANWQDHKRKEVDTQAIEAYSRKKLTKKLAGLFDGLVNE